MINQVVPNNVQSRTFNEFSQPQNGWYLAANLKEIEEKNKHKYGKTIAASSLVAGFGILALMKGAVPKTIVKYLEKLRIKLEQKSSKSSGKFQRFYGYSVGKIADFSKKTESINNLTTLKDVLFQKFMFGKDGNWKITRKIHENITTFFNKISRKTVNSAYANTHEKFASLNEYMISLNEQIMLEHPKDANVAKAIESIKNRMVKVNDRLENGFGINARNQRLSEMEKETEGLFEHFWNVSFSDRKNFTSRHMWQSFIAEDYMFPYKLKVANTVGHLRQLITHDINDSYKATTKAIDNLQKFVNPSDVETYDIIVALRNNLKQYKKLSGKDEIAQRIKLNQEITDNLKRLSDTFRSEAKNEGYTPEAVNAMSKYVEDVERIISQNSKGELQEILTEYKPYLSRGEYLKLKSRVQEAVKSLDKSIDIETVQYMDKARDLKLGSAPTDVLSILATVGTVGWFLGKSKDKDERISASLKYGIPAIGAIATSLYSTARLVSGGKSLALGLVSGWVMNIIGSKIDDLRKQYSLDISLINKIKENAQETNSSKKQAQ